VRDEVQRLPAHHPRVTRPGGVEDLVPEAVPLEARQRNLPRPGAAVQEQQHRVTPDQSPAFVTFVRRPPRDQHPQETVLRIRPIRVGHLRAVRPDPHHVLLATAVEHPAEERAPPQHGIRPEDLQRLPGEPQHVQVSAFPVEPAELVVLAVGVVVPLLRAPDLVAAEEHPYALGEDERGHQVALHPLADLDDLRLVTRSLDTPVGGEVLVGPVLVPLAVGLVVLLRVHHEVLQGEAVVRGREVDRGVGVAAARLVQVAGTGQPERELRELPRIASPEPAHAVAVLAVPLGPADREVADLVAAGSDVPRLGDQLHLREHRVLLDDVEERPEPIDLVQLSGQDRRQVEAEAVDVHLEHPMSEAVHDQLDRARVQHVEAVPGPREVDVVTGILG
jgi:hypothetical protein